MTDNLSFKIRSAKAEDKDVITHCVQQSYRHYITRMGKSPGPMLNDYEEIISLYDVFVMDVFLGKECISTLPPIAGVLVLIKQPASILLDNIAVDPAYQARGLGKELINHAEQQAANWGYQTIELYTHVCMVENIVMYPKLGYTKTKEVSEKGFERVYFEKQL